MQWDLFCRVVDNFGDIGVCWRLAADLGSRGESVRLFVDDASALSWLAPGGSDRVAVHAWADADSAEPGDVVVEAFGCDPPEPFVARMAARAAAPAWINLEYLSAEPYVERSHGLSSPVMAGPGKGLLKWFYYPGFTMRTGGLIREPWLAGETAAFDRRAWLGSRGIASAAGERIVSLFCYHDAPVERLIDRLSGRHVRAERSAHSPAYATAPAGAARESGQATRHDAGEAAQPVLLLATPGPATELARAALGDTMRRGLLRCVALPFLDQRDFDRLLWSCDLNFVRGEDSFVRAQWACRPFVWQAYPQDDDLHRAKVDAFLELYLADAPPGLAKAVRASWHAWNAASARSTAFDADDDAGDASRAQDDDLETVADLLAGDAGSRHALEWKRSLARFPELTHGLMQFVARLVHISR